MIEWYFIFKHSLHDIIQCGLTLISYFIGRWYLKNKNEKSKTKLTFSDAVGVFIVVIGFETLVVNSLTIKNFSYVIAYMIPIILALIIGIKLEWNKTKK